MAEDRGEAALGRLLGLVGDYQAGRIGEADLRAALTADPGLVDLARRQAGGTLERAGKAISFGAQSQIGQVQIRDVAAGDIIYLTINVAAPPEQPGRAPGDAEEIAHKRTLIAEHRRVLHQLELQAAKYGISTPPYITIEIQDRTRAIAELRREIGEG